MKRQGSILIVGLLGLAVALGALFEIRSHAQSPTTTQPTEPSPTQQKLDVPTDPQTDIDIRGNRRYLVGPGDILDVRVFGQPDLNSTVEIDDEGNISSLPFIETPIPAMCHNEKEIQKAIAVAYSKYLKSPKISVRVTDRRSRPPAAVFGAVRAPTRVQMMRRVRLHELLAAAGGITLTASGSIQIIHTERQLCAQDSMDTTIADALGNSSTLTSNTVEKGISSAAAATTESSVTTPASTQSPVSTTSPATVADNQAAATQALPAEKAIAAGLANEESISLSRTPSDVGQIQIYQTGDVRNGLGKDDPYIRPGDIVIVTEGEPIYVNGFVNAPREIVMKDGMTLGRAIAMAGGIQKTAKGSAVRVYRLEKGRVGPKVIKVDYDAIKKGGPDFMLQAYDIIDVRPSSMVSPASLQQLFKGVTQGTMGGLAGSLPYRILY